MSEFELSTQEEVELVDFERPHVVILGSGASIATWLEGDASLIVESLLSSSPSMVMVSSFNAVCLVLVFSATRFLIGLLLL